MRVFLGPLEVLSRARLTRYTRPMLAARLTWTRRIRRSFRPSRRPQWAAIVATTLLAALFPYFENIHSANELARLYIADALIYDKTVSIDGAIKRHTPVPDKARRNGKTYSDKAPGITLAIAPALKVLHSVDPEASLAAKMRVARLFGATLPLLVLLLLLAHFLSRWKVAWRVRLAVVVLLALASPLTVYGVLLFGHGLAATLLFATFVLVDAVKGDGSRRDVWRCIALGATAGFAVCVEYPSAVFSLPAAALFLYRLTASRPVQWTRAAKLVGAALVGAAPFAAFVLGYHQVAFGSPFATGYAFLVNKAFANVHAQGFMGITYPHPQHLAEAFVFPTKGLFVFAPAFVLALVPGSWAVRALPRPTRIAWAATVVVMILFVASMVFPGGGWTVSQRHLVVLLPFAAIAIALGAARLRTQGDVVIRVLLAAGILAGLTMCGASLFVWPYLFDDLQSPVAQLIWPALRDGWRVPSTLAWVGLSSVWIAVAAVALTATAAVLVVRFPRAQRASEGKRMGMILVAFALPALYVGLLVVTAPAQDRVVQKRRTRLEIAYFLDPSATPVHRADPDVVAKEHAKREAAKRPGIQRATRATPPRLSAADRLVHQTPAGRLVTTLLNALTLTVITNDGTRHACDAKLRAGKIACPKFGAGVFVRLAVVDTGGGSARAPALRAYLPREGGTLEFAWPENVANKVGAFTLVSHKKGVEVTAAAGDVTRSLGAAEMTSAALVPPPRTTTLHVSAVTGDRELFLLVTPPPSAP